MKAIAVVSFGGPEVLQVVDLPEPHPGKGEVRIRVRAAAVNPTDTGLRAGLYGSFLQSTAPHVPGMDAAGVVDEVGEESDWAIGDEVMAIVLQMGPRGGAYAEQIVVPADSVARIPSGVDFVAASTLPMNGLTARRTLDQLDLQPKQTIAVTGAAGAYGGYVVQMAKASGLSVIADASESDETLVSTLGADLVVRRGIDVAQRIRHEIPQGVDGLADGAVLDGAVLPAIRDAGGMAVVRSWSGPSERGITIHQTWVREYALNRAALDGLRVQVEQGFITPRVAGTFPAEQAGIAHRELEAGGRRGRFVLEF